MSVASPRFSSRNVVEVVDTPNGEGDILRTFDSG